VGPVCWFSRRYLGAYRDGELASLGRRWVGAHLERCRFCAGELADLERLHAALALDAPDPGEPVWAAFWPQVRERLAGPIVAEPVSAAAWWRAWGSMIGRPRLAFGSVAVVAALGVLAILAPWQDAGPPTIPPVSVPAPGQPAPGAAEAPALAQVLIQSVETDDPQSAVMVFDSPESDVTVLWVFGLPPTDA
jgi:hypothetical protein